MDAAVKVGNLRIGNGVAVRNSSGELLGAMAKPVEAFWSVRYAELMAIYEGICFCMEAGFTQGEVISDCLNAVWAINWAVSMNHFDSNCLVIERLQELLSSCPGIVCLFEPRETNHVAHCIAKYATHLFGFESWLEDGPQWLFDLLGNDMCTSVS